MLLTSSQLDIVHGLARALAVSDRAAFLTLVKQRLAEQKTLGDGVVFRIASECRKQFWKPPLDTAE